MKSKILHLGLIILLVVLVTWVGTRIIWPSVTDFGIEGPYVNTLEDSVQVRGVWRHSTDLQGYTTRQSVVIDCREQAGECAVAQSFVSTSEWLYNEIGYYDISEWGGGQMIRAEYEGPCANSILTIDVSDPVVPSVKLIETYKQEKTEECGLTGETSSEWTLDGTEPSWFAGISSNIQDLLWEVTN